jgi:glycosyltransferase involved in cell wall biosynthesis
MSTSSLEGPAALLCRNGRIHMVVHPAIFLDEDAAPPVHVRGIAAGLRAAGLTVTRAGFPTVSRMLSAGGGGGAVLRVAARLLLPWAALASALSRPGDLHYFRHYYDFSLCYAVLRLARRPFVVEVNATLGQESYGLSRLPRSLRAAAAAIERVCLRGSPVILVVSGALRAELVREGYPPDRVRVVQNGCSPGDIAGADAQVEPSGVLFVGNFKPWHGVDRLAQAFALIAPSIDDDLLLAGDGPARAAIAELVRELGVASRTRFLGRLPRREALSLMRRARVLVLADATTYGSPIKLFEYLASGRPAVLPRVPAITEVVGEGGPALLFTPGDVGELAAAIRRLVDDPELARRTGQDGRDLVSREYTWNRAAERALAAIGMPARCPSPPAEVASHERS